MIVTFEKAYLKDLYKKGRTSDKKHRYQLQIISRYQKRIEQLQAAPHPESLYQIVSLHFEALKGDRTGLYSVRENDQYRIEFKLGKESDRPFLTICNIVELSNHYSGIMIKLSGTSPDMISNNLIPANPTHPGEFLREEIEERGISQTKLAEEIGMKVSLLNELINGKRDFTIEYAMMLEAALGIDADYWINLQTNYSKAMAKHNSSFMAKLADIRRIAAIL